MQNMIFATVMGIAYRVNMLKRLTEVDGVAILKELDDKYLDLLRPIFERFTCPAGEVVLQQGSVADYLYIVLSGKVQISFKPYDGSAITVSHLEKDGLFGWSAVVGSKKYTSSAIAIEDLEAFRIRGSELRKLCKEHPDEGKIILERLADAVSFRWKDAHEKVKSIITNGMKHE